LADSASAISNKIWIYGNGSFAQKLATSFTTTGIEILGFMEMEERFRVHSRIESIDPCIEHFPEQHNFPVILGLGNAYADIKSIAEKLKSEGYSVVYPLEAIRILFLKGIEFENYWMTGDFEMFDRCHDEIDQALNFLSDARSQAIFKNILEFRKSGDPFKLYNHDPTELSYLPEDIPWIREGEVLENVIDAGAYDGDTLRAFLRAEIAIENWWCFEPDLENFRKLTLSRNDLKSGTKIRTIPCALWRTTEMLTFTRGGDSGTGSAISQSGVEYVLATSVDEINNWESCSLIKMDIEGAELDALKGSFETIRKNRPKLAICVYHKPTDLWEIINYIGLNFPNYYFYLRSYFQQTFETVLYAVPN
jgi:FkbM family methyltransferase